LEKFIHARHIHLAGKISRFRSVSIMSLFGDAIHNFIDGLIIAASFSVNIQVGIASTIAVILHEIPQEMGNFAVLLHGGFTKNRALFLNFLTALTAFLGVIVLLTLDVYAKNAIQFLIPFAAGNFIYIAGSDLIPELQREVKLKKSAIQIFTFILGIAIMYGLLIVD
ncbi:MAG: ZIP family metal transporter, partial [Patescibacteria group bacterium]